jgi:transcription elongation factor Elf1
MTNYSEIIDTNIHNLHLIAKKQYENLKCNNCGQLHAVAFFTENKIKKRYGIWIICKICEHTDHIDLNKKPMGFTRERIKEDFQSLDENAWSKELD